MIGALVGIAVAAVLVLGVGLVGAHRRALSRAVREAEDRALRGMLEESAAQGDALDQIEERRASQARATRATMRNELARDPTEAAVKARLARIHARRR